MNRFILPKFTINPEIEALLKIGNVETGKINSLIEDLKKQCFVNTATWGLDYWEQALGITTNINISQNERRAVIRAKLKGMDITTKNVLESVAEEFMTGKATVIEHHKDYCIDLVMDSDEGFPYGPETLYHAISEIIPAHICVDYHYISKEIDKVYIANGMLSGEHIVIYPYAIREITLNSEFKVASGYNLNRETINIFPKGGK